MMECLVEIRGFFGATSNRTLTTLFSDVRCMIGSARMETAAFYENVPLGQLYEFVITDQTVTSVPDGAEITITDPQSSGLTTGSVFIIQAKAQRQRLGGKFIITGVCYQKEDA